MIIVSDTTPVISLLKIGHLDLLKKLFTKVVIPQSVFLELTNNPRFRNEADAVREADYISVYQELNPDDISTFGRAVGLDKGESEAILLAVRETAEVLLMDEAKGRQTARQMGINIMGTIGILIISYKNGLLSQEEVRNSIGILRESGRHISDNLYRILLDETDGS